ncbi:BamA/TamA family outer membrane protein [Alkalimonas sp. NCh-2]|uniref:BamA/TamA family outer membrane protein n=1 Tax=Alkalimonas sp. NCh-2 TaxID=3144846 RepID=UPI0031F67AB6
MRGLTLLSGACLLASAVQASDCQLLENTDALPERGDIRIRSIDFDASNVFDLNEPGTFWLHRFANYSHIITREDTLQQDLLFAEGDKLSLAELEETERLLRSRRYLREAKVSISHYCSESHQVDVLVESWDNWSLLPKIDFKHEGGVSQYSIGIAEDNLLGTGNQLQLDYAKDSERTGYLLSFASPNMFGSHWSSALQYADNSDGESYLLAVERPFYRISSPWAMGFELEKHKEELREYQRGEESNRYDSKRNWLQSYLGFSLYASTYSAQRLLLGLRLHEQQFASNLDTQNGLPLDRDLSALWLEYQWLQSDYQKLYQINQFNRTEDINFGWQWTLQLARLTDWLGADANGWQLSSRLEKNWTIKPGSWLLTEHHFKQQWQSDEPSRRELSSHWLLVHHLTDQSSLAARFHLELGREMYRDELHQLGGDNGMRAYPLYFQRGQKLWVASGEYRYYTPWSILRLFDVGFAGFVDAGRAWDDPWQSSEASDQLLFGVGGGVRLLSKYSSRGTMVHLDLAKPLRSEPGLDSWQFRAMAKRRF